MSIGGIYGRGSASSTSVDTDVTTSVVPIRSRRTRNASAAAPTATELRARWRRATMDTGWSFPGDWWVPAVDAITEAFVVGRSVLPGFHRLGMARSEAGVPMQETLCDASEFTALAQEVLTGPEHDCFEVIADPSTIIQVAATGWAERINVVGSGSAGNDPLTQLARPSYLPVRLGEIYRAAEARGQSVSHTHALVVTSLLHTPDRNRPFDLAGGSSAYETIDRSRHMVTLSGVLHDVFSSGETLALLGPSTAVVIAPRDRSLATRVTMLRELLEHERLNHFAPYMPSVGVWVEGLPKALRNAEQLLGELKR